MGKHPLLPGFPGKKGYQYIMTDKQLDRIMEAVRDKERALTPAAATPQKGEQKAETAQMPKTATPAAQGKSRRPKNNGQKDRRNHASGAQKPAQEAAQIAARKPAKEQTQENGKKTDTANKPAGNRKKLSRRPATEQPAPAQTRSKKPGKDAAGKNGKKKRPTGKLRVMSLGGLQEIGKNITVLEYGNDIVVVDCGMGFPDEDMLGVDLVIPDLTYLEKNLDRVRGVLLTHGHEDHIGGVPYLLRTVPVPVYGTRLTIGILEKKLEEFRFERTPVCKTVEAGDRVKLGEMEAEFIHVNHSIADACCIAIRTPVGTVVHSGDFKLDVSPIDGKMMDLTRLGEIGNEGVELLLCESTNAERPGFTPSERSIGGSLEQIFLAHRNRRLVIATFSSNVHRVQQIIDASARHGRRVAIIGRSMVNVIGAAVELGYMDVPEGVLIDVSEIRRFAPEQLTLITTGSQGEPMSALYRMAFGEHDKVKLSASDVVVISASAIPGNEKLVGKIINALVKSGIKVLHDNSVLNVHVSGHACQEELKLMHALLHPKYFMPIHGEYRHLYAHKELAEFMGMPADRIFVSEIGKVLEVDADGARFHDTVPAGQILVDGAGIGDVGAVVLRDRKHLAEDGLIVAVATVDMKGCVLVSGPDLISRGFVYVKESTELMDDARAVARDALERALEGGVCDFAQLKGALRDDLSKYIYKKTKRNPMILSIIMDV